MKIALSALQKYFEKPLPPSEVVSDAFTFHAFEIEDPPAGGEGDVLDIKVLPNRAPDCSTDIGIARALSAILDMPLKREYSAVTSGTAHIETSLSQINGILGADFSEKEVFDVFRRLQFAVEQEGETYLVTPPAERTDLSPPAAGPEDIAEEVGQILGYDRIPATELPPTKEVPDQSRYRGIERMKDQLVEEGYVEISTQSFANKGDIELANPMDKTKPFLRTSLEKNLKDALELAKQYAPLTQGPHRKPKLFEVGSVFPKSGEYLELRMTEPVKEWGNMVTDNLSIAKLEEYGKDYMPKKYKLSAYKPFSVYPFITRDIAFWAPKDTNSGLTKSRIEESAGELLVRIDQFDRFDKGDRVSLAYRLIFQAMDRTLTDSEVNGIMEKVSGALVSKGFEIR